MGDEMKLKAIRLFLLPAALTLLMVACGGGSEPISSPTPMPTPTQTATATQVPPTATEVESPTPTPMVSPTAVPTPPRIPPTPKPRLRTYDLESLGIPRFVGVDWIELDKIGGMSRFRSGIGHDFSHLDVYEEWSCRSMKHYYFMRSRDNLTNVFAPVNAEVIELIAEGKGDEANTRKTGQSVGLSNVQVRMRVTNPDYTAFVVILFHVDLGT